LYLLKAEPGKQEFMAAWNSLKEVNYVQY